MKWCTVTFTWIQQFFSHSATLTCKLGGELMKKKKEGEIFVCAFFLFGWQSMKFYDSNWWSCCLECMQPCVPSPLHPEMGEFSHRPLKHIAKCVANSWRLFKEWEKIKTNTRTIATQRINQIETK